MARIPMTSGFTLFPAGTYVFRIFDVKYDEEFGKMEIFLVNAKNMVHKERYSLMGKDGEPNEAAMNAFSFFAKTALNNYDIEDVDPMELIGHYIQAEVVHTESPSTKYPGRMNTFANLGDKAPASAFDIEPVPAALTRTASDDGNGSATSPAPASAPAPTTPSNLDLDSLLG